MPDASARLGETAYYRVLLGHDPWMDLAVHAFDRAAVQKGPSSP